jgi:hypothetical protein
MIDLERTQPPRMRGCPESRKILTTIRPSRRPYGEVAAPGKQVPPRGRDFARRHTIALYSTFRYQVKQATDKRS